MLIAREKLNNNIVEYLLYMFHIEDIIRANHLNIKELERNVINSYKLPENQTIVLNKWYQNLIAQMIKDDARETGHMVQLKEIMFQLNDLHIELLNNPEEERYLEHYHLAKSVIHELKMKMGDPSLTEIEVCINGLYGFMLLRMKKQQITGETSDAIAIFSLLLRYLAKKYHEKKSRQVIF